MMSTWFVRFLLFIAVCLSVAHSYPSSMSKSKWLHERLARPYAVAGGRTYDYVPLADETDNEPIDNDGAATWLFRARKFCCAPPL